jgi:hypothetical protein
MVATYYQCTYNLSKSISVTFQYNDFQIVIHPGFYFIQQIELNCICSGYA